MPKAILGAAKNSGSTRHMKFVISREALLKPLSLVAGVVERRHTLPVLANVLVQLEQGQLSLTGSDAEVELVGRIDVETSWEPGEITVPARKFVDICKSLPDNSMVEFALDDNRAIIKSGRSRFTLSVLPAGDFPKIDDLLEGEHFLIQQGDLKAVLDQTTFAMAQQDVRYYLNGMLWEIGEGFFRVVATDGHRLALATLQNLTTGKNAQVIIPRKGVIELSRLLQDEDEDIQILVGGSHIRASTEAFTYTSKLVDGKFPDYQRVLPSDCNKEISADRETLKSALSRASILSNEKYRGVRLRFGNNELNIVANNPEQEQAEETISIDYDGDLIEIGFNVSYLLDVMNVISGDSVKLSLSSSNSSALIENQIKLGADALYVVMPMKL
jgi:DNA polymerase-3 subunit beta